MKSYLKFYHFYWLMAAPVFILGQLINIPAGAQTAAKVNPTIAVDSKNDQLLINGKNVKTLSLDVIEKILGKPSRIMNKKRQNRFERWPATPEGKPWSTMIAVTDYYYIYDQLGIMFYTKNSKSSLEKPEWLYIEMGNKRTFTNVEKLPYAPLKVFQGKLLLNGTEVRSQDKLLAAEVNYKSKNVKLLGALWGVASTATQIDRFYLEKGSPYMQIFLDSPERNRASFIILKR